MSCLLGRAGGVGRAGLGWRILFFTLRVTPPAIRRAVQQLNDQQLNDRSHLGPRGEGREGGTPPSQRETTCRPDGWWDYRSHLGPRGEGREGGTLLLLLLLLLNYGLFGIPEAPRLTRMRSDENR